MKNLADLLSRRRVLRSAGFIALALLALYAWRIEHVQRANVTATANQARLLARSTAAEQQAQLAQAHRFLRVLSGISLVRHDRPGACNAFLARQLERVPRYDNVAFVDTRGGVLCRAKPLPETLRLPVMRMQERPYVFAVQQQVALAVPQFGADGRPLGAVVALLPAADFFPARPPSAGAFGLADAQGKLLLAYPENFAPAPDDARFVQAAQAVAGAAEALQLWVRLPVPAAASSPGRPVFWGLLLLASALLLMPWHGAKGRVAPALRRLRQWRRARPSQPAAKSPSDTQVLRSAYADLKGQYAKKDQRVRQLVHLDELSQRLQSCASRTELANSVARCAQAVFPGCHGALFLRAEAEHYGLALAWGGSVPMQSLQVLDCHALHGGQAYLGHGASALACAHARQAGISRDYACIPLHSVGGPLGLLYLAHEAMARDARTPPWAATAIAERSAIALATLQRQEQLQMRAIRDALTGLFNRGFMEEALGIEQQRARRRGSSIGVMLLDVDHFKRYNDSFGHAAGDALLRGIGGLMQRAVREGDMACRYGGEEFVLILPGADLHSTQQRAEALRATIEHWRPDSGDGTRSSVTVSIGVACFAQHGMTWQAVLKRADQALYAAKHAGRNRVLTADACEDTPAAVSA